MPDLGIPYLAQTLGVIVSARAGWLSVFFAGLLLTMVIMRAYICSLPFEILPLFKLLACTAVTESFEEVLEANVQLSFFVPLIVGHAGNTGSQAVSTVIRALALSEAALCDSCHITRKEFLAGGAIGLFLASFAYPLGVWIAGIPLRVMFSVAVSLPCVSCVSWRPNPAQLPSYSQVLVLVGNRGGATHSRVRTGVRVIRVIDSLTVE